VNSVILKRARLWTMIVAAGLSFGLAVTVSPRYALGVFLTATWAAAGFWMLEGLTRRALLPPGSPRAIGAIATLAAGKVLLYGVAVWALLAQVFPPTSHLIGFSLLLIALVAVAGFSRRAAPEGRKPPRGTDA
jgi:hypothetical protein